MTNQPLHARIRSVRQAVQQHGKTLDGEPAYTLNHGPPPPDPDLAALVENRPQFPTKYVVRRWGQDRGNCREGRPGGDWTLDIVVGA